MSHGGLKECSWTGTKLQPKVFSVTDLCSLFVLQLQTDGFKFIFQVRPKAEIKRLLRAEPNK